MIWTAAWAWALALAAVLPIAAHLWSRRRPVAVPFPTLRFLRAASPVSRRLRRVQDWPLLLLRLAIVAVICAAAAGPTLVSPSRQQSWRTRLHRIVVVDAAVAAQADDIVARERRGASSFAMLGPGAIADLIDEAIARAARHAGRMRTEVVIVWDGSRDAVAPRDLEDVPATTGLRLVPVESPPRDSAAARPGVAQPVTVRADAADALARDRLLTAVSGLSLAAVTSPIEIVWPATGPRTPARSGVASPELRRVLDDIADDVRVRDAAERSSRDARQPARVTRDADGRCLARSPTGEPLLRGWAEGDRLVLVLDATPSSPLAWWAVVAALESIARPWAVAATPVQWSRSELSTASREPALPPVSALPGGLDTRVAWAIALGLLLLEQMRRRRRPPVDDVEVTHAA